MKLSIHISIQSHYINYIPSNSIQFTIFWEDLAKSSPFITIQSHQI